MAVTYLVRLPATSWRLGGRSPTKTRCSNSVTAWHSPSNVGSALIQVKQLPIRSLFSDVLRACASEQSRRVLLTFDSDSRCLAASYDSGFGAAVNTNSTLLMTFRFSAIDWSSHFMLSHS